MLHVDWISVSNLLTFDISRAIATTCLVLRSGTSILGRWKTGGSTGDR